MGFSQHTLTMLMSLVYMCPITAIANHSICLTYSYRCFYILTLPVEQSEHTIHVQGMPVSQYNSIPIADYSGYKCS